MARITDSLLIQRVDDADLVVIDESTGAEVLLPVEKADRIIAMIAYLTSPHAPDEVLEVARIHLNCAGVA